MENVGVFGVLSFLLSKVHGVLQSSAFVNGVAEVTSWNRYGPAVFECFVGVGDDPHFIFRVLDFLADRVDSIDCLLNDGDVSFGCDLEDYSRSSEPCFNGFGD